MPQDSGFVDIASGEYFGLALTPEPSTLVLLTLGAVMVRRKR
ncbi:MAG: PEP-CTERM sorting domain-containing protein [Planctomycetota bacterium]